MIKVFQRYIFTLFLSAVSLLVILLVGAYFLIATPIGGRIFVHYALLQAAQSATVDIESFNGNLKDGLIIKNLRVRNWPMLGPDASINVQRLDVRLPVLDFKKVEATIFNARLDLKNSEPMLFHGTITDGKFNGDVEARSLDVKVLLQTFLKDDLYKVTSGMVSSVKFDLSGDVLHPTVKGGFVADRVTYGDKVATQIFAKVDMVLSYENNLFQMKGLVILDDGHVTVNKNTFDLVPSKVVYGDNITDPSVDLNCTIHKDIYDIDINILGTVKYNKITARSDPYLPQEQIFILLGLGNWSPLNNTSPNLQSNANAMGIKRKVGENLNVGYGYEQSSQNFRGESNSIQFVQGQMALTPGLSVNVQRTVSSFHERDRFNATQQDQRKDNESRLYLQYRNTF